MPLLQSTLQLKEKRAAIRAMSNEALIKSYGEFLRTRRPLNNKDDRIRFMYEFEFQRRCKEEE